jgi:hypothetical protein
MQKIPKGFREFIYTDNKKLGDGIFFCRFVIVTFPASFFLDGEAAFFRQFKTAFLLIYQHLDIDKLTNTHTKSMVTSTRNKAKNSTARVINWVRCFSVRK